VHHKESNIMKRRDFLQLGLGTSAILAACGGLGFPDTSAAEPAKKLTDKDILKEGAPTTIANYCTLPDKQPNKFCPAWKEGHCETCQFFNKDNSLTTFKGGKYARCQLLADPSKAQFVSSGAYCATYVKKS
jgi:hypothetical protein